MPNVKTNTDLTTGILKSCTLDHFVIMLSFEIVEKKINRLQQHIHM